MANAVQVTGLSPTQKNTRAGIQHKLDAAREAYLTSARVYNREAFKLFEKVCRQRKVYVEACALAAEFAEEITAEAEERDDDAEEDFKLAWAETYFSERDEAETPKEEFENYGLAIDMEDTLGLSEADVFRALPNDGSAAEIKRWEEAMNGEE